MGELLACGGRVQIRLSIHGVEKTRQELIELLPVDASHELHPFGPALGERSRPLPVRELSQAAICIYDLVIQE